MTDKQMHSKNLSIELDKSRSTATSLIIDGVDVSGCRYLFDDTSYKRSETTCSITLKDCKYLGNNCYYKQLKRKEQECEKAKQNAQDTYDLWQALIESFNILQGEKIKLEQECEELKAKLELFKTSNQTTIDQLKAENEDLKKSILQECPNCGEEYLNYKGAALYFENSDLKQILAEIKEIVELKQKQSVFVGETVFEQILQKINEVENAL